MKDFFIMVFIYMFFMCVLMDWYKVTNIRSVSGVIILRLLELMYL